MRIATKIEQDESKKREEALRGLGGITNEVEKWTKELEKKSSYLPIVEEDGSSECPFAEDLYAQKEEAEEKLKLALSNLNRCIPFLSKEISRCRNNLNQICSDGEKLISEKPKDSYSSAEQKQNVQLRIALERQKRVNDVLKRAKLALEIAESQKFPGKIPQRKGPGAAAPSGTGDRIAPMAPPMSSLGGPFPVSPVVSNPKSGLSGETGGILSTGPLR